MLRRRLIYIKIFCSSDYGNNFIILILLYGLYKRTVFYWCARFSSRVIRKTELIMQDQMLQRMTYSNEKVDHEEDVEGKVDLLRGAGGP